MKAAYPMAVPTWFDDVPVLGKLPPEQAVAKLREVGEDEAADALENAREEARSEKFGIFGVQVPHGQRAQRQR